MATERFSPDEQQKIIPPYVTAYATPKIDVRGAVFHDGAILLVKERGDGLWTLPGGWADVNESPSTAVAREVVVETTPVAFFQEDAFSPRSRTRVTSARVRLFERSRHPEWPTQFERGCYTI